MTFGSPEFFEQKLREFGRPSSHNYVHVLLHSTNGNSTFDPDAVEPIEPFRLADRMWICRMPDYLRDAVYKACEPPGELYEPAYRQYGQLYTIALFMGVPEVGTVTNWDGYNYLSKFVTYSQLVHPTSIGFGSTAVLIFGSDGNFKQARPGPCRGYTEQAFTLPDSRNWLSRSECETVKKLFDKDTLAKLPDRVSRALWNVQQAAYQYFFEMRMLLVASALDSLINIKYPEGPYRTGLQFKTRTVQLADEVGILFTKTNANDLWGHRSDVAHGKSLWPFERDDLGQVQEPPALTKNSPVVRLYLTAEQILRSVILRCLADRDYAARFETDESVGNAYPLPDAPKKSKVAQSDSSAK